MDYEPTFKKASSGNTDPIPHSHPSQWNTQIYELKVSLKVKFMSLDTGLHSERYHPVH